MCTLQLPEYKFALLTQCAEVITNVLFPKISLIRKVFIAPMSV
jgi:hypothetical protein